VARPVDADAAATKARVLHAASKLVSERGIEGTSIRDVAAAAKVSLATVVHYFGNKEGLYEACIAAMYAELEELRTALFASVTATNLDGLVKDVVHAAWAFVRAHKPAHRILLRNILDEGGMRSEHREKYLRPFLDDVGAMLAPATGLPKVHVRLTAQTVVHLTVRYAFHNAAELEIITGERDADRAHAAVEKHIVDVARAMLTRRK
jgi:AcrR family transcriptional regulator